MVAALADWIEKGYRGIAVPDQQQQASFLAFLAGGPERHTLLCGIPGQQRQRRSALSAAGRRLRLFIRVAARWDLCPKPASSAGVRWSPFRQRIFRNLQQLEGELLRVREPEPRWTELPPFHPFRRNRSRSGKATDALFSDLIENRLLPRPVIVNRGRFG